MRSNAPESSGPRPHGQRGVALLVILAALVLVSAAILLERLNAAAIPAPSRDAKSMHTLAQAKRALIAWAATHPDTPGLLPFPDRNDDVTPNYDGEADCVAPGAIASTHLLGSLPIRGEQTGCTTSIELALEAIDSSRERLWYAVSRNLVRGGDGGPINPDIGELATQPWLTVRGPTGAIISDRVAAVIIAPGPVVGAQDRTGVAPAANNFLDSVVVGPDTYNNADADGCRDDDVGCVTPGEDFYVFPSGAEGFNDRLVFITIDELMLAVEDRVLGEAANALRTYKGSNPGSYYPWMGTFSDPRSPQGAATGGSATTLVDAGADFLVAGVSDGDLVRNLTDGSIGPVATGGVTATTLTLVGLIGGAADTFVAGDRYVVHAPGKFQGNAGAVEGMLPLHMPNEVFQTGFTINWNYSSEKNSDTFDDGNISLIPTVNDVDNFNGDDLTILPANGQCKWTASDRVDCWGTATLLGYVRPDNALTVDRTVEVWFNFTAGPTTITAPTATDVRRRNHTFNGPNNGPVAALPAPDMPQKWTTGPCCAWTVHVEDTDGVNVGWRRAERDPDTDLVINKFDGIRYEIGVPDELPTWFVENNWHHFVHSAVSGAYLPTTAATSGAPPCETPPIGAGNENDDCLTIEYSAAAVPTVRNDVEALVIGPGSVLAAQDRNAATACAPQPPFLCDYFEPPNSDAEATARNLVFGRALGNTFDVDTTFNDQIRPVLP